MFMAAIPCDLLLQYLVHFYTHLGDSLRERSQHICPHSSWVVDNGDRNYVNRYDSGFESNFVPQPELWLQKQQPCIVQSKAAQAEKLQQRRYL